MASQREISATYDYMDAVFRATFGPNPDITCALYDGDFSKTLEQAQGDKHRAVLDGIRVDEGSRLLDVGCGWGPLLRAASERGARALGLTLSPRQVAGCRRAGLQVRLLDWKDADIAQLGRFDAVSSIGAFEHFCSEDEHAKGEQEEIYERFFAFCGELLPPGGGLFLQTMSWGKNAPDGTEISTSAPRGSAGYIVAVLRRFYPGSYPPHGLDQIARCAAPWFSITSTSNGRLDYIRTMEEWGRVWRPTPGKLVRMLWTLRHAVTDRDFFAKLESIRGGYNRECFRREILDHHRIFFARR